MNCREVLANYVLRTPASDFVYSITVVDVLQIFLAISTVDKPLHCR